LVIRKYFFYKFSFQYLVVKPACVNAALDCVDYTREDTEAVANRLQRCARFDRLRIRNLDLRL